MRLTDHHVVGIKRQLKPNTSPDYPAVKAGIDQLGTIHTTFGRNWTVEQDTPDQSTYREDASLLWTTATYSDVTNLITPGPKTVN